MEKSCCNLRHYYVQALDTERYVHVLESILGRRSSSTNLLPEPTAHRSNSEGSKLLFSSKGAAPEQAAESMLIVFTKIQENVIAVSCQDSWHLLLHR